MAKTNVTIGDSFCFDFRSGNVRIKTESRKYFDAHRHDIENWWLPSCKVPLFLDTNILLESYNYSKEVRNLFVNFLKANKDRIFIVDQVDEEYQRKRPNFISNYKQSLTSQATGLNSLIKDCSVSDYCDKLVVRLENLKKNPYIRTDFSNYVQDIEKTIARIREWKLATTNPSESLKSDIDDFLKDFYKSLHESSIATLDDSDIVDAIASCRFCDKLSSSEYSYILQLYERCLEERSKMEARPDKIDMSMYTFPGYGDLNKDKEGKQREGDFILYHEILKEIKRLNKDVIFITSDIKKKDNATDKQEPYDHYISNCYALTKHVYYLVDGKSLPLTSMQMPIIDTDYDEEDEDSEDVADVDDSDRTIQATAELKSLQEMPIIRRSRKSPFRELTKDEFVKQLKICTSWAHDYGDNYVSKDYFVYGILGHKRYKFADSMQMLIELEEEGVVKEEITDTGKECILMNK